MTHTIVFITLIVATVYFARGWHIGRKGNEPFMTHFVPLLIGFTVGFLISLLM